MSKSHNAKAAQEVVIRKIKDLGPLHDLLLKCCPPSARGFVNIEILSGHLGMSAWGVYKWIKAGKVPPNRVNDLVSMSDGRATLADFIPYVFL